jgi:glycerol-3-phosphate acyltransferase PlsX
MPGFDYTVAIDAMGGDNSPNKIIDGLRLFLKEDQGIFFNIYGKEELVKKSLDRYTDIPQDNYKIINCKTQIEDKNSVRDAIKIGKDSSMWKAIESIKNEDSNLIISSGNTGALLVISKLIIKMIEGIDKPALAGLWPNFKNTSVVLDLGANIDFNEKNYLDFSNIGAELYRALFDKQNPVVGLLNVGSEEIKGHEELKNSFNILSNQKNNFDFYGYLEGNQIKDGAVDVVITDGFSGNIALKTAEGTVNFINTEIKKIFSGSFFGKLCYLISMPIFKKIKKNLDPRKYNGGIFLGLNAPVVKSHGGADALAFYYSIKLSAKILRGNLINRIKINFSNE